MTPMLFALYGVVVLALVVLGAGIGALILIGYYAVVEVCIHREHNRRR